MRIVWFLSNIEKGLSVHLASKHAKYSEIEADESYCEVADDVIEEETRVADEESYASDAAKAVDKIRRHWYICCPDGFIAVHKGVMYNGSLCKTTQCEYCYDE